MIIIKISGGLGNQLFEYAFARSLSIRQNEKLYLSITDFRNDCLRDYRLHTLGLSKTTDIIEKHIWLNFCFTLKKMYFNAIIKFKHYDMHNKKDIIHFASKGYYASLNRGYISDHYNNSIINYFSGNFQSCRYFDSIRDVLLKETKPLKISNKCSEISTILSQTNSVCVHIRRGDYVEKPERQVCTSKYYNRGIDYIRNEIKDPIFYFFSDDIDWVKQNYIGDNFHYIDSDLADYEDLYLMTLCKNYIIANSTFSWWGQYLCQNKNKIVIAPDHWYSGSPKAVTDIYMQDWILISTV